jgi:hypothetical protein
MDRTHEDLPALRPGAVRIDLAHEHPVGAGYDRAGHRDSSVPHPQAPRRHTARWLISIAVALLAVALLVGWLTWAAPG